MSWRGSGLGLWVSIDALLHGLLVFCRHLVASLCASGGGPVLPGRYHGTMVIKERWEDDRTGLCSRFSIGPWAVTRGLRILLVLVVWC